MRFKLQTRFMHTRLIAIYQVFTKINKFVYFSKRHVMLDNQGNLIDEIESENE
jgi:hypothetical protein